MPKLVILIALTFGFMLIAYSSAMQQSTLDILKTKFLPAVFVGTNFTAEDARKILKERCRKVSGDNETVFLQAHRGVLDFIECVSSVANLTEVQEEIEVAKPIGELDTIFQNYCGKRSRVELCLNNLMSKINPCLNNDEKARHSVMVRVASKLLGFVCHKGGDQIALFFAEEGPECLEENKEHINNCINASFAEYIPKNVIPDLNNLPQPVMGKKECKDIQDFEKCVLFYLGKCSDITPSNIIESVFKYVKNETQCDPKPKTIALTARSAGSTALISFAIPGVMCLFLFQKLIISEQ